MLYCESIRWLIFFSQPHPRNWRREANGILTLVGTSDTASGDFRTEKSESCSLSVGAWAGPWHFSPQVCTWLAITADYNSGRLPIFHSRRRTGHLIDGFLQESQTGTLSD
ncbi:hypothetical protein RIR_jg16366.t1 [Rhizophagus irregularis DAOM 181602=DAOM 197198]|nr:hypothetical protein RIR_jg16366.t1 [Rhizophagus irregularis DAOM 181602=DAOM 197198]